MKINQVKKMPCALFLNNTIIFILLKVIWKILNMEVITCLYVIHTYADACIICLYTLFFCLLLLQYYSLFLCTHIVCWFYFGFFFLIWFFHLNWLNIFVIMLLHLHVWSILNSMYVCILFLLYSLICIYLIINCYTHTWTYI